MDSERLGATKRLASLATDTEFREIPPEAISCAKNCILDCIGVAAVGSATPASTMVWETISSISGSRGVNAVVVGREGKVTPIDAALVNSTSAHSVELDDFHRKGSVHPAVSVIPAALAIAQQQSSTGAEFLSAVVVGYEVMIRVGMATCVAQFERGFHPTSTCGVFGSAAAAGRLLGLNRLGLAHAFGIAGSFSGGLREWKRDGTLTKPLQVGRATQNGALAAILASIGYTGPATVIEGELGFCRAYANGAGLLTQALDGLGDVFEIENIAFKPYASGRASHPAIDAVLWLKANEGLRPSEIQGVVVKLAKEMHRAVMWPEDRKYRPETVSDAQFSLPYCVAAALLRGSVLLSEFTPESIRDPDILELAQRVRGEVAPECEEVYPEQILQIVDVTLKGGRRLVRRVDYPKGDPENPMTREELQEKFSRLASPVLGASRAAKVVEIVERIEMYEDLSELYALLSGTPKAG